MKDIRNYSLLGHNTFGVDVCCRRFLEYSSVEEAQQVVMKLTAADRPLLILGGGSNLLLTDNYGGTVLHSAIKGMETVNPATLVGEGEMDEECGNPDFVFLRCGSGETFDDMVAFAVENGYHGAENLSIIPGEVGASAVQNIGAYGVEAKDIIYKVEAVEIATGKLVTFCNTDCQYAYRQSRFKHEWKNRFLITHEGYRLFKVFRPRLDYGNIRASLEKKGIVQPNASQLRDVIIEIRNAKLPDPKAEGNAGSFFMNPIVSRCQYEKLAAQYPGMPHYTVDEEHEKIPAGWLIEQCGWKGKSLGNTGVYDKQALVLVNHGGAKGAEIVHLSDTIRRDVKNKFGIDIHPEVNIF